MGNVQKGSGVGMESCIRFLNKTFLLDSIMGLDGGIKNGRTYTIDNGSVSRTE